jgi:hypothetical protein
MASDPILDLAVSLFLIYNRGNLYKPLISGRRRAETVGVHIHKGTGAQSVILTSIRQTP